MTDASRSPSSPQRTAASSAGARPSLSPRQVIAGGMVQSVAGVVLILLGGTIAWHMTPMLLAAPGSAPDGSHFNASAAAARLVLALLGAIVLFGGVALANGAHTLRTREKSRPLLYLLYASAGLIALLLGMVVLTIK